MASSLLLALLLSAPCPTSLTFAPATGRPPLIWGQDRFAGMVGSSFVMLTEVDWKLSGAKIDVLHPDWREVPDLDLGRWIETSGRGPEDKVIVVGQRLLAASWRGKLPIRVAIYDPQKNTWRRPDAATPPDAWHESNVALRDWWLTGSRDGNGGYRFHPVQLTWTRMKPAPVAGFSMSWPSAAAGNKAYFFADRAGAAYDADSNGWTVLPAGGPTHPAHAYASSRTGRIAVLSADEPLAGAVYDPAARAWTPIAGTDQVVYDPGGVYLEVDGKPVTEPVGFSEAPSPAGPYVAFSSHPEEPIWLLDIDAARWRPVPRPHGAPPLSSLEIRLRHEPWFERPIIIAPPLPPEPKLLLAGETIFLESETCLDMGGGCLTRAHMGEADHLDLYEPESGRWCSLDLPAAAREALGGRAYFRIERVWRNHLLLWEVHKPAPAHSRYIERVELVTDVHPDWGEPRGGVISW